MYEAGCSICKLPPSRKVSDFETSTEFFLASKGDIPLQISTLTRETYIW